VSPLGALQLKATDRGTAAPLRATAVELPVEELLAIVSFPVSEPVAVGANCRLNVAVWPAFRVRGNVAPDTVNPVPDAVAELTVTAAVPVDDRVSDWVAFVPTGTLPKATLVEFTERVAVPEAGEVGGGVVVAATPVPVNATVTDAFDSELSAMVSWPVALPAAVGANCTLRFRVLFAATVAGSVPAPLTVKALPVIVRAEITTGFELELARASLVVAGDPTVTLPKATLPGETLIVPALALGVPLAVLLAVRPPQPDRETDATATAKPRKRREESRFLEVRSEKFPAENVFNFE
jgi:hypothetical protein